MFTWSYSLQLSPRLGPDDYVVKADHVLPEEKGCTSVTVIWTALWQLSLSLCLSLSLSLNGITYILFLSLSLCLPDHLFRYLSVSFFLSLSLSLSLSHAHTDTHKALQRKHDL